MGKGHVRVLRDLLASLRAARDGYGDWDVPHDWSISKTRARPGLAPLQGLFDRVAGPVGTPDTLGVF